ncbi:DNA-deoxyinosine glycosylase [Laribacter hongkongensis]|uniref:DNA-deoxyinosine glycosylase n=1 Tax=Laribacter hongkongensis TaxID=168471 RepID=UPI001EFDA726|nr:DNA-deoxyinosine glycosylase [Laribacter hongkongensis]MCG9057669.1 DNA-deoxyinosine glycosylase [Laribacter hongkongensis]MCG9087213.1 DNA-deoxyinosine glycosylase [Laribacter hongkongensis]
MKRSFAPVVDAGVRVLILGSLPGEASLAASQYYAHPQNQFWRLLGSVLDWPELAGLAYEDRLAGLLARGIGLWDVVAQAHRRGSLDAAIRDAVGNDLPGLVAGLPALRAVAFNGQTAWKARRPLEGMPLQLLALPSSSPAYTRPFADKLAAWRLLADWL